MPKLHKHVFQHPPHMPYSCPDPPRYFGFSLCFAPLPLPPTLSIMDPTSRQPKNGLGPSVGSAHTARMVLLHIWSQSGAICFVNGPKPPRRPRRPHVPSALRTSPPSLSLHLCLSAVNHSCSNTPPRYLYAPDLGPMPLRSPSVHYVHSVHSVH
jgi:hypothetical protein